MDGENTPPQLRNTGISGISLHQPQEIIEEILSRLPVKSLLRLRCVSKSWRRLIGRERFVKAQLQKSRKYQNYTRWQAIFNYDRKSPVPGLKRCSVVSYLDDPSVEPSPFDDPTNNHLMICNRVVGHCDGLLCILKQPGCLFLWNPTTGVSIELPKLYFEILKYGFGRDEQSGAYKVFAVGFRHVVDTDKEEFERIGKLYSSKTNSWKRVEPGSGNLHMKVNGEFVRGKIHWLTEGARHVEYLDLKSEVFGKMEMPFKLEVGLGLRLRLSERTGRLILISENETQSDVWVMKDERWVKGSSGLIPPECGSVYMVCVSTAKGLVKFSPRENIVGCNQTCFYIESLVSPKE